MKFLLNLFSRVTHVPHADVILNIGASLVLAAAIVLASRQMDQDVAASYLLLFAVASIGGWLLTMGASARLVIFVNDFNKLYQATLTAICLLAVLFIPAGITAFIFREQPVAGLSPIWTVFASLLVALALIGREIGNIVFGRARTAALSFLQSFTILLLLAFLVRRGALDTGLALILFLSVYYGFGVFHVVYYLLMRRPRLQVSFGRGFLISTISTNFLLALANLIIGNFDKIILAFRPDLSGIEVAYVFSDRFATLYVVTTNFYTQSQIQKKIMSRTFVDSSDPYQLVCEWIKRTFLFLLVFLMGAMGIAAVLPTILDLPVSVLVIGGFLFAICITAHVKNGIGFVTRLSDLRGHTQHFNGVASSFLVMVVGLMLVAWSSSLVAIVVAKLLLHIAVLAVMMAVLRKDRGWN